MFRRKNIKSIFLLSFLFLLALSSSVLANESNKIQQHSIPILSTFPTNHSETIRPDTKIQIVINKEDKNFNRFRNQFEKGFYNITINGSEVSSNYDKNTNTITLEKDLLERYTNQKVCLTTKADMQSGKNNSDNASYCFEFTTGSALNEAKNLQINVEKSPVRVIETGKLYVKVTDDYGLPAKNATVTVTGDSSTFQTQQIILNENSNGEGLIPLANHVKEIVKLTVTAKDNFYHDPANTQVKYENIEFLAGPPFKMTLNVSSSLLSGQEDIITGDVFDKYNNRVEDFTLVNATSTAGVITPSKINTNRGNFKFNYVAPNEAKTIKLLFTASESGYPSISKEIIIDITKEECECVNDGKWTYFRGSDRPMINNGNDFEFKNPGVFGYYHTPIDADSNSATFEARIKTLKNDGYHGLNSAVGLRTTTDGISLSIYTNKIELYDNVYANTPLFSMPITGDEYHLYRLIKDGNKGVLYIDNNLITTVNLNNNTGFGEHWVIMGDWTSRDGSNVEAYYKDVKVNPCKAIYPNDPVQ